MANARPPGGRQSGNIPTARIGFDYSALRSAPQVAREAGRATAREIAEVFKLAQAEQRVVLEQARQTTAVLRAQQTQITAVTKAESAERRAIASAEATAKQQAERRATITFGEEEKRRTAVTRSELRQREAEQRASLRASQAEQQAALRASQAERTQRNSSSDGGVREFGREALGVLGIGAGLAGVAQAGRAIVEAEAAATAYRRQSVAARELAGSQARLNELLATYERVTGGAVDRATSLAQVTRLLAVGFANSSEELERIVTISRGAALAMGTTQDYILGQMQLALANQTTARLDQIGVGVEEFQQHLENLRETNRSASSEMLFQMALLDLMEQKFGALANSAAGQTTATEKARVALQNFRLELGEFSGPMVAGVMTGVTDEIKGVSERFQELERDINRTRRAYTEWQKERSNQSGSGAITPQQRMDMPWWQREPWYKLDPIGDWGRRWETGGSGTMKIQSDIAVAEMVRRGMVEGIERAQSDLQAGLITPQQAQTTIADFQSRLSIVNRELEALAGRLAAASGAAPIPSMGPQMSPSSKATASADPSPRFTDDERAAIVSRYRDMVAIQRQQNEQIAAETRSYGQQRAQTIANYEKQISREAEDFARQRANAERRLNLEILDIHRDSARQRVKWEADLQRTIGQARADSAERVAEWEADRNEQLAKTRAESTDRIVTQQREMDERISAERVKSTQRLIELERDANKERERADTQYRRAQLSAAARLDAYALYQEQQRYADEQQERAQANREALEQERTRLTEFVGEQEVAQRKAAEQERTNLQKRLDEEQKAHDKRLAQEARALEKSITQQQGAHQRRLEEQAENDRLRIEDMRRNFEDQKRQEDDERGIRLGRMREDHNDQLAAMATAHGERIKQINDQAEEERKLREDKFQDEMSELGVRTEAYANKVKKFEDAAITSFDKVYEHILDKFKKTLEESGEPPAGGMPKQVYANGGWVGRTGNALVHQGEFVLSRAMLNNAAPIPPGVRSAVTNNSTTTSLGGVNITIVQQPGQSPQDMLGTLRDFFDDLAGPYRQ